jgi:5,10-methylenetetrahydromethanopterin reductase
MQVGIGFNGVGIPLRRAVELARQAEEAGLDSVWVAEDGWITGRDAVSSLGAITVATERIQLGTNLLPAHHSRHLHLLAATVAAMDELSHGRFILGLGAGTGWPSYPARARPLRMMREATEGIRTLIAGGTFELNGHDLKLQTTEPIYAWELPKPVRRHVPIYLAGRGPKMTQLVGEIADGLLIELYVPPTEVPERLAQMRIGAERAGRDPATLEVACNIHITASRDGELDERLRSHIARWYATRVSDDVIARAGLDPAEVAHVQGRVEREGHTAAGADVTRPMVDALCAAGTPDACRKKLLEYQAAGVTHAILMPFGGDPDLAIQVGAEYLRAERGEQIAVAGRTT